MERLLAKLDTDKKEMLAEIKPDRKTDTERMMARMDTIQEKADANQETTARMDAKMGSMKAELKSAIKDLKFNCEETMACQEIMEARLQEDKPASVDTTPEVARDQEVPVEDAARMSVGEPGKRRRDRHLAAGRRQKEDEPNLDARRRRKQQERTQSKHGCRKDLIAARRGTTCRAVVARRRILFTETARSRLIVAVRKVSRRATVARRRRDATKEERDDEKRAPGERTLGKRRRVNPEGNTAMKDPDARRQLRLGNVKAAGRVCWGNHENVIRPKIAKRTARS
jgi:hypothetical protein